MVGPSCMIRGRRYKNPDTNRLRNRWVWVRLRQCLSILLFIYKALQLPGLWQGHAWRLGYSLDGQICGGRKKNILKRFFLGRRATLNRPMEMAGRQNVIDEFDRLPLPGSFGSIPHEAEKATSLLFYGRTERFIWWQDGAFYPSDKKKIIIHENVLHKPEINIKELWADFASAIRSKKRRSAYRTATCHERGLLGTAFL